MKEQLMMQEEDRRD